MYKVGINFDEISDDPSTAIKVMDDYDVTVGELRTVNGKNFVFWTDDEVDAFKQRLDKTNIEVVAAATPLFKWYVHEGDPEVEHDSFGFNARIGEDEKKRIIARTFEIASYLSIPRLRIFSCLGEAENAGQIFGKDPLLSYSLELADQHNIDLLVENEPVCRVHNKAQVVALLNTQKNSRLKFWLDIANMLEIGEEVDDVFLQQVASRLGYVHVKDYVIKDGQRIHVPVGEGEIDYATILAAIDKLHVQDLIFTVETHAKTDKVGASITSIKATKALVSKLANK